MLDFDCLAALPELCFEIAHKAVHGFDTRARAHLDVGILSDLLNDISQKFLGVAAIEKVVQMPQVAPQLFLSLYEIHFEALPAQAERGRHPGYPASHDDSCLRDRHRYRVKRFESPGLGHRHTHQVFGLLRRFIGLGHVNPRALVADVGHLEEIGVQTGFSHCLPKNGFVGSGGAGSYDDAVQVVLEDNVAHVILRVLRTGVEVVLGVGDVGQLPGVLRNVGHVYDPADVDPAMADKNADPGLLPADIPFRRIRADLGEGVPDLRQKLQSPRRRAAGLRDCLGDILRAGGRAAHQDAGARGFERPHGVGPNETVGIEPDPQPRCQGAEFFSGPEAHRQHDHVVLFLRDFTGFGSKLNRQLGAAVPLVDIADPRPDEAYAVLRLGPFIIFVKLLAEGPHVHEKYGSVNLAEMLLGDDGFLDGVHAAHRRAVAAATRNIARAHAL